MNRTRLIRKYSAIALMLALCAVLWAYPALAADGARVAIPVSAFGADCRAALLDANGAVLQTLGLKDGEESAFTLECEGLGRHRFSVRLTNEDTEAVRYDHTAYRVFVDVYYQDDVVAAAVTAQPEDASGEDGKVDVLAFTNVPVGPAPEPEPAVYSPVAVKRISGEPESASRFTFVLTADGNTAGLERNPMPGGAKGTQATASVTGAGRAPFGDITFDAAGEYVYRVSEVRTDAKGYEYDTSVYTLTIAVAPNAAGTALECAPAIALDGAAAKALAFTNTYTPEPAAKPASYDPPVRKVVNGSPGDRASFTFALSAESNTAGLSLDDMPMPAGSKNRRKTVSITGAGTEEFGAMSYTAPGIYVYAITEVNGGLANYTYDTSRYTLTVKVTRSGDALRATASYAKGGAAAAEAVFTNTYTARTAAPGATPGPTPEPTTSVTGRKVWVDDNNAHKTRPASITVRLYADGAPVSATPSWSGWSYTFDDLPMYNAEGVAIRYTVGEEPVPNYESSVSGTIITNTLVKKDTERYITISGQKEWDDDGDADGVRPESVVVRLKRDGAEVAQARVSADTGWRYSFENQPADDGYGNIYAYTVREDSVGGYFARVKGTTIVNARIRASQPSIFSSFTEQELAELVDLFDYDTALWGSLLRTGDETPIYPYVFGGIGVAALIALAILARKRRRRQD